MKRIIVGVDGSKGSFGSYKCAASLFSHEDVSLNSLFVRDERKTKIPFIYSGAAYDIAYERLYIPIEPQLVKTFDKLNEDNKLFAEKCIKKCENIETGKHIKKSGMILEGDPSEVLIDFSKKFDLLVLGQRGENAAYAKELIGSTSEDLIRRSLIPVLICPGDTVNTDRILIVFENSKSSENALEYYVNSLSEYNSDLTILVKKHIEELSSDFSLKIKKLKNMGKNVSVEYCKGSLANKAIEIMENSLIDAIVLGSHGKHKLTEYLLGTVTVHIIRKSSLPVFIVH